jgi:hypothetical protein
MSITEKLASRRDERLARIHSSLKAKDWIDGAMYDEAQGVTMNEWVQMVEREMDLRGITKREMVTV